MKSKDILCGLFRNSQGGSHFQVLGLSLLNPHKLHAPTWSFCVVLKKPVTQALPMLQWAECIWEYMLAYSCWPMMSFWHLKKCVSLLFWYGCRMNTLHTNTCQLLYQEISGLLNCYAMKYQGSSTSITLEYIDEPIFFFFEYLSI